MKILKKIIVSLIVVMSALSIPMPVLATEASEFSFSMSATVEEDTLTVTVIGTAPAPTVARQMYEVYASLYLNDNNIGVPTNAVSDSYYLEPGAVTAYSYQTAFGMVFCQRRSTQTFSGGEMTFTLKYDVSDYSISNGDILTLRTSPAGTFDGLAAWASVNINVSNPENPVLATYTFGNSGEENDSSYSAYLSTDATEIAPGSTYTSDLYMKSDDALSAGEIDLAAANGKITNIALADGIGMTQVDDVSDGKTEVKISFDGNTASAKEGLKIATITVQAADSLTDGSSVELNISNAVAAKTGSTKDQTVTLGEDAKVAVPVITAANCSCESYAAGKYLVKYTGTVVDGEVAKYGEEEMFWSPNYASWVYLTNSDVSQTLRDSRFSSVSGTKKDLTCTGDVNGNSVVNIVDAQVAYDIANSVYSDFTNPTMEQWLMADVNADSMVDASDARAIQCIVHGMTG